MIGTRQSRHTVRAIGVVLASTLALGGITVVPADAAKKKTGCAALKTKKKQESCKKLRKTKKYRKGQVCALSAKKQAEYGRYGYFCLDISADQNGSLTYLEELGR